MPHIHRSIACRSNATSAGALLLGLAAAQMTAVTTAIAESASPDSPPSLVSELDPHGWTRAQAEPLPDPEKWNWQVLSDRDIPEGSPGGVLRPRPIDPAPDASFASRTDLQDGSAAVTVGRRLPTEWETKIGVDLGLAADPSTTYRVDPPTGSTAGRGAAWANLKIPGFNTPLTWDQAQIDARIDPTSEQGQLGTRFSRSLPIGESLSLTLQNGYAVTQSFPDGTATSATTEIWSTDRSLRVTLPDSGTSFSAKQSLNSLEDKWLGSISAEQKMFGGPVSLNGSASETATGEIAKSVTATFRKTW